MVIRLIENKDFLVQQMAGYQSDPLRSPEMFKLKADVLRFKEVENQLKEVLGTSVLSPIGPAHGGCISQAQNYNTDQGHVFVKINQGTQAKTMFNGEVASLAAIRKTCTVNVPEPIMVSELPTGGALLIMKHIEMRHIGKFAGKLGEQLADLHLDNWMRKRTMQKHSGTIGKCPGDLRPVDMFGFHTTTCCGYIPQINEWQKDWGMFFVTQRLQPQFSLIEKDYADRILLELWSELQMKIQNAFKGTVIVPSLLHGDLWEANVAEDEQGPVVFDPGSFYGHSEYDLSIDEMFGIHSQDFFTAYHRKIPREFGFEVRHQLYQLFHSLNNWNHFGLLFREGSLNLMRCLLQIL
ncbi:ketosamine-3-kinase-like isoform X2 [Pseudophryne corroboree]|uniref:ketosamine-3-kinase-like isoform X2 n=1 Tax=Pseudophryne corroboree TaxID=495146 RepID=UPI00308212E3